MMKKVSRPNTLLLELVIVLLFFSLSACVILQLFVAAHDKSVRSVVGSWALMEAEDIAEKFAASQADKDTFFAQADWRPRGEGYERYVEANGRALLCLVAGETRNTPAGYLDDLTLTLYKTQTPPSGSGEMPRCITIDGEHPLVTLPLTRYRHGEGTP
ncbi:MAG: hypothetical protein FWF69_01715 [Firmicutes bacterium]|nr:hypothetical protein [Bacillota bacterium]